MTTLKELRAVASSATQGGWADGHGSVLSSSGTICQTWNKCEEDFPNHKANATHIATFNPSLIIAMLEVLKATEVLLEGTGRDSIHPALRYRTEQLYFNDLKEYDTKRAILDKLMEAAND